MNIYEDYYNRDLSPVTTGKEFLNVCSMSIEDKRVALTELGNLGSVSTVFLRMDHNFTGEGPPVLFETLVFGGKLDGKMERYCTEAEALAGHERMVERVRKTASLWNRIKARFKREPNTPKHVHAWGKWEEQSGMVITKARGSNRNQLGSQLYRRHCSMCGESQRKWM